MLTVSEANATIKRHQAKAPVEVVPIAEDFGLKVFRVQGWPDSISGMIKKDGERGGSSGYAIFVNGKHPEVRRRFTIAHEIAHFVLHRDLIGDGITDDGLYRSGLSNTVEAQANKYAADILMPWHLVNGMTESGLDTVEALAKHFKVSKSAMAIRLGVPYETAAA